MLKSIRIEIMIKLKKQQNICFWWIINVYKIILLIIMKIETYIFSLNLHLNSVVSWALKKIKKSNMMYQIKITCMIIKRKLYQKEQNYQISLITVAYFKFLSADWIQFWISNMKNVWSRSQNSAKKKLLHKWKTW